MYLSNFLSAAAAVDAARAAWSASPELRARHHQNEAEFIDAAIRGAMPDQPEVMAMLSPCEVSA